MDLTAQNRDLMPQGQQFREHDLVAPSRVQQGVEHANRDQIDQWEHHDHDGAPNSRIPSSQQVRQVLAPYMLVRRTSLTSDPVRVAAGPSEWILIMVQSITAGVHILELNLVEFNVEPGGFWCRQS